VTVNGQPVARLTAYEPPRRRWLTREQLLSRMSRAQADPGLRADLAALALHGELSAVSARIIATAKWTVVVRVVTPVIFTLTYLALLWAIFAPPSVGGMMPAL